MESINSYKEPDGSEFGSKSETTKKKATATKTKGVPKPKKTVKPKGTTKGKKALKAENTEENGNKEEDSSSYIEEEDNQQELIIENQFDETKTLEQIYQKKTQLEHIILRPDSYIGSVEKQLEDLWIYDEEKKELYEKKIEYVPGLFKIFDEILVNAADNKIRNPEMSKLKVVIDQEKNLITIWNNGKGIPIEVHKEENVYIPELIFGHLLTSSNYDDKEKKVVGGRNGYGAKLCNIFSKQFIIETGDSERKKKYIQKFTNNMSVIGKPKITNYEGESYTSITFNPDLEKFHMEKLDDDMVSLLKKRAVDMAGVLRGVSVFLNGKKVGIKGFKEYCNMYLKEPKKEKIKDEDGNEKDNQVESNKPKLIYDKTDRWEVGFVPHDKGTFQQVSFVNSISTSKGGTHVKYVADKITEKIEEFLKGKKEIKDNIKTAHIRNNMMLFVNCSIENPAFDSQTKETLKLKVSQFGSKYELSENFIKGIKKSTIIKTMEEEADFKAKKKMMNAMDSNKKSRVSNIDKLDDANWAGTRKSSECTLILTEGDSAKTLAMAGLSIVGRDKFGVFPLKGKLLNVRDASTTQITNNSELKNICTILGLNTRKTYTDTKELRYGHIMIMTDQDPDGSHIKGLLINYLDHFFPSLLKIKGFLQEFITPIVKAYKGRDIIPFYTIPEYEAWKDIDRNKNHRKKYFKGLATSTSKEAKEYFSDLDTHKKGFLATTAEDRDLIDMAFSKKRVDARKDWITDFVPGTFLDQSVAEIEIKDFINKELIQFSMADNARSIPNVIDGLKPGQRKIIYGCFLRNLKEEIKVAQLIGYIAEKTAYHHGEQSLASTIVNLAQHFIGSNNLNLLEPVGMFGSRELGGKDAGSSRYIFTNLMDITRKLFHPDDMPLLNYLDDDGLKIEPDYYVPILPLILINGAEGIGTGWSTNIPKYNPKDIIDNIYRKMNGEEIIEMTPWYRGFIGEIKEDEKIKGKYNCNGIIERIDETHIKITELPVGVWTGNYKKQLEDWRTQNKPFIKDYTCHETDTTIDFIVELEKPILDEIESEIDGLIKKFKLTNTINTSNMICFNAQGKLQKYFCQEQIFEAFYQIRYELYIKRKNHLIVTLDALRNKYNWMIKFLNEVIQDTIIIKKKKKIEIVEQLKSKGYPPIYDNNNNQNENSTVGYNYLLKMHFWNLSYEEIEEINKKLENVENQLDALIKKTPIDLWKEDIDAFLISWEALLKMDQDALLQNQIQSKSKVTKKRAPAKPRVKKEINSVVKVENKINNGLDSNVKMESKPNILAALNGKVETKPKIQDTMYSTKLEQGSSSNGGTNNKVFKSIKQTSISSFITKPLEKEVDNKKRVTTDSDSEDGIFLLPLEERTKLLKGKGQDKKESPKIKKKKVEKDSDEIEEEDEIVSIKPIGRGKKVIKQSDEDEEVIPNKSNRRGKRKVVESESEFEQESGSDKEVTIKPRLSRRAAASKASYTIEISDSEQNNNSDENEYQQSDDMED